MKIPSNELVFFMMLGACLAIFVALFINIFSKISLHAIGVGSLVALLFVLVRISTYDMRLLLLAAVLVAGIVGTARLILQAHDIREIYSGYLVGFTGQFVAFIIVPKFL